MSRVLAGLLTGAAAMLALLVVPVTWAGAAEGNPAVSESAATGGAGASGTEQPIALAHTGLDLTIPILVGLGILAAGTLLVAWAVLRGSRSRHAAG